MSNLNFSGVEEAGKPLTSPGTKAVFTLKKITFGTSKEKNTPGMTVELEQAGGVSQFKETFYTTEKAMPRIQHLHKAVTGAKIEGTVTEEQLVAKLEGKKVGLKVIGRVGSDGNGYPALPFGGFACSIDKVGDLEFTVQEQNAIAAALKAAEESRSKNSDSESSGGSGSAPTSKSKSDDDF
jgi:hypothetical protein